MSEWYWVKNEREAAINALSDARWPRQCCHRVSIPMTIRWQRCGHSKILLLLSAVLQKSYYYYHNANKGNNNKNECHSNIIVDKLQGCSHSESCGKVKVSHAAVKSFDRRGISCKNARTVQFSGGVEIKKPKNFNYHRHQPRDLADCLFIQSYNLTIAVTNIISCLLFKKFYSTPPLQTPGLATWYNKIYLWILRWEIRRFCPLGCCVQGILWGWPCGCESLRQSVAPPTNQKFLKT